MIWNWDIKYWQKLNFDKQFWLKEENKIKEIFQVLFLKHLFSKDLEVLKRFAFLWWTCLRIVYKTWRYSEDLDFSLYDIKEWDLEELKNVIYWFWDIYKSVSIKEKNVNGNVIKFELVISDLRDFWYTKVTRDQKVKIKFEFDINPPDIWNNELDYIDFEWVKITVHSKRLLKSGKMSAILFRWFYKGRDFFDLDVYNNDERFKDIDFDIDYIWKNWEQNIAYVEKAIGDKYSNLDFSEEKLNSLLEKVISWTKTEFAKDKISEDITAFAIEQDFNPDVMLESVQNWSENFSFKQDDFEDFSEDFDFDFEGDFWNNTITFQKIVESFNYWNKNNSFSKPILLKEWSSLCFDNASYFLKNEKWIVIKIFNNKQKLLEFLDENKDIYLNIEVLNWIRK